MGEEIKDNPKELSAEEIRLIEGKAEPSEGEAPVELAGEEPAETVKPSKDNLIPQPVFDQRVAEIRSKAEEEAEKKAVEKFKLFQRDPEEFYTKYPDERPAQPQKDFIDDNLKGLIVQGGRYEGMTIEQVLQVDQPAGIAMVTRFYRDQERQIEETRQAEEKRKTDAEQEIANFQATLAKDLFKKNRDEISDQEAAKINEMTQQTLDWMKQTGRGFANVTDGYFLMTRETSISKAKADGAAALVTSVGKTVQRISSARDPGHVTGYEADLRMTTSQLADKVDKMRPKEFQDWMAKAPEELKKKHPALPW